MAADNGVRAEVGRNSPGVDPTEISPANSELKCFIKTPRLMKTPRYDVPDESSMMFFRTDILAGRFLHNVNRNNEWLFRQRLRIF